MIRRRYGSDASCGLYQCDRAHIDRTHVDPLHRKGDGLAGLLLCDHVAQRQIMLRGRSAFVRVVAKGEIVDQGGVIAREQAVAHVIGKALRPVENGTASTPVQAPQIVHDVAAADDEHALVAEPCQPLCQCVVPCGWLRSSMLSCTTGTSASGNTWVSTDQVPWSRPHPRVASSSRCTAVGASSCCTRRASGGEPGAGYWTSNSARGKPPKSWRVRGCAIVVPAGPRVYQCAETARTAAGRGRDSPSLRHASL